MEIEKELTPKERNTIIRYAFTIGTRAKCSTNGLYRPLRIKELQAAFKERDADIIERIDMYRRKAEDYAAGKMELSDDFIGFFGGVPTNEQFEEYCLDVVRQEKSMLRRITCEYQVSVNYAFTPRRLLQFHKSLNPRVTFGYTSMLHEECDFELNDERREAFLASSLAHPKHIDGDMTHDYGYIYFDSPACLFYEDLRIYSGERCILATLSHEQVFEPHFDDEELNGLIGFEQDEETGKAIIAKLKDII